MPIRSSFLLLLAPALLLSACANQRQQVVAKDDMLEAAGFADHPANTPARQDMLRRLPPERFVQRTRDGQPVYVFADPLVCNCLYVGDQAAYGRYVQEVQQRQIAQEQWEAERNEDAAWNWDEWDHSHGHP
jgi:hypothetical protein